MKELRCALWVMLLIAWGALAGCATSLGGAAIKGDLREVNRLVQEGADLNEIDGTGGTALHRAAEAGKTNAVKFLAEQGANLNIQNRAYFNFTPLHMAVRTGHPDTAKVLIEKGADVNAKGKSNWTPLHLAAWYNLIETARLLVEAGADPQAQAESWALFPGGTPLEMAQRRGHKEIADLLIKAGTTTPKAALPAPRPAPAVLKPAPAKDLPKVAVWDLTPREVKTAYAQELTSILVSELTQLRRYEVYSQENVRTLAGWTEERMRLGCTSTQCLIALGQMDIAKLISGSVGKIGDTYTISLNLFDTQNARAENAVSDFCRSENELIALVQRAVGKLLRAGN